MPDKIDWSLTTHEGNRCRQHEEFHALPFREKLARIEQLGEVVSHFGARPASGDKAGKQQSASRESPLKAKTNKNESFDAGDGS